MGGISGARTERVSGVKKGRCQRGKRGDVYQW